MGKFSKWFGSISVIENNDVIYVEGVPVSTLASNIVNFWFTRRISLNMLINNNNNGFTIDSFFGLELVYILNQILHHDNRDEVKDFKSLHKLRELLLSNTWLKTLNNDSNLKPFDYSKLNVFRFKPKDYQINFLKAYKENVAKFNLNGFMLAGAPGSGKTFIGICLSVLLDSDVTIIISPKNAVYTVWENALKKDFKIPQDCWIAADNKPLDLNVKYYIFHYETLGKAFELLRLRTDIKNPLIILDESHSANEVYSNRTQQFIDFCKDSKTKNILWASGTPIKATSGEMIPFLRTIDPLFNESVEKRFLNIFNRNVDTAHEILNHRIGHISFKITKYEFRLNEPTIIELKVSMPNGDDYTLETIRKDMVAYVKERTIYYTANFDKYKKEYDDVVDSHEKNKVRNKKDRIAFRIYKADINTMLKGYDPWTMGDISKACNKYEKDVIMPELSKDTKEVFKESKSVVKYMKLKIQGEALGRILGRKRINCHLDMIKHIDFNKILEKTIKKVVIFSSWTSVASAAADYINNIGYKSILYHGLTPEKLPEAVKIFSKNDDVNPLITTFKSLSTAVPLIAANAVILLNAPFRDYEYKQTTARVDRLGQDTEVYIYNVFLDTGDKPNISTRSKDIMTWSRQQVEAIMGIDLKNNPEINISKLDDPDFAEAYAKAIQAEIKKLSQLWK